MSLRKKYARNVAVTPCVAVPIFWFHGSLWSGWWGSSKMDEMCFLLLSLSYQHHQRPDNSVILNDLVDNNWTE